MGKILKLMGCYLIILDHIYGKRVLLLFSIFVALSSNGQNLMTNNWAFGHGAGIDFSTTPPTPFAGSTMETQEGSTAMSDRNTGDLLFYTNSDTTYDANHNPMPNGMTLYGGGHSSWQGVITVPDPADSNSYYIFSVGDAQTCSSCPPAPASWMPPYGGFAYHKVDMTLNGGAGDVSLRDQIIHQVADPNPQMWYEQRVTGAPHCNGRDWWVIVRRMESNNVRSLYAYLVNPSGVQAPVLSPGGQSSKGFGGMKFSPDGSRFVFAGTQIVPNTGMTDPAIIEVFDFDQQTGIFTPANTYDGGTMFNLGLAFSPNSQFLYFAGAGLGTYNGTYQIDLSLNTTTFITTSLGNAMQAAIDGNIYISPGSATLTAITDPDIAGVGCNYTPAYIASLAPGSCWTGICHTVDALPTTTSPLFNDFSYSVSNPCDSLTFDFTYEANGTIITGHEWVFDPQGSATTSSVTNPSHTFSAVGSFDIQLVLFTTCGNDTLTKTIVASLGGGGTTNIISQSLCGGDSVLFAGQYYSFSGSFYDTIPLGGACDSIVQLNLSVIGGVTPSNISICSGDSLFLQNAYQQLPGTYLDTFIVGACDSVVSTILSVVSSLSSNTSMILCQGDSALVGGAWQKVDGVYSDTLSSSIGCDSIITSNLVFVSGYNDTLTVSMCNGDSAFVNGVYEIQSGFYTTNLTSLNGCDSISTTELIVGSMPILTPIINDDNCFETNGSIAFSGNAQGFPLVYDWNIGSTDSSLVDVEAGDYSVTISNGGSCSVVFEETVLSSTENCGYHVYVANVFSPNGDGENDILYVRGKGVSTIQFVIYNRWGNKVFETDDMAVGWDGSFRNLAQGNQVFIYEISAVMIDGTTQQKTSNISVIK